MEMQEICAIMAGALPEFKFKPFGQQKKERYCDNSKVCA